MSRPSATEKSPAPRRGFFATLIRWFDTTVEADSPDSRASRSEASSAQDRVDVPRVIPFIAMHLMCLGVIWVGWSWIAVAVAVALYLVRMFAITGWYHRYFSHRTFKTRRWVQFLFAAIGNASVQRGPLWWAAHHRKHHRNSDRESDVHSPRHRGLFWSHMGWFTTRRNFKTDFDAVKDLGRYPELRLLDRFDILVPALLAAALFAVGEWLRVSWPGLGTDGWQLLVWGFFISTVVLYHATYTINSLAHTIGSRRYETDDDSRNNFLLALITLGEGWHNNHHRYPGATRQGFYWWEVDLTYYGLLLLEKLGLVWDLHPVPARLLTAEAQAPGVRARRAVGLAGGTPTEAAEKRSSR